MPASPKLLRLQGRPSIAGGAVAAPRGRLRTHEPSPPGRPAKRRWSGVLRPELLGLLLLAALLNCVNLAVNGDANTYYSAAVKAMAANWHDFVFGSADASGVMTVDKPPAALWVQALSVRLFGYSSWSLLLPQAVMGVATVGLAYDMTARRFGRAAGAAAGLVLALTPMTVAMSRHNNPDALLVLCVVASVWAMARALDTHQTRWLAVCGAAVGLAFETKMGAGLLVVPGLVAAWLWVAPRGRVAALRQGLVGAASALVVGLAWPVLVWLTPAGSRPWISGTTDNSIWSLILQYNGLGRLVGQTGGNSGASSTGGVFGGSTGALRLLNESLGGQAGWLIGAAVVAAITLLIATRARRGDPRTGWLIAVGGAFAVSAVAFSTAEGIFHPYYVSELAPFTALLVGAGVGTVLAGGRSARLLGPLLLAGGLITELIVLEQSATDLGWLEPVLLITVGLAAGALAAWQSATVRRVALAVGIAALLAGPGIWSAQTLGHSVGSTFPAGGPASASTMGGGAPGGGKGTKPGGSSSSTRPTAPTRSSTSGTSTGTGSSSTAAASAASTSKTTSSGGGMGGSQDLTATIKYVEQHGGGTVAIESQQGAADSALSSDSGTVTVVGIGGFSGKESTVTISWLAHAVKTGQIRYVLVTSSSQGMGNDSRQGSSTAMAAAKEVGTATSVSGLYDLAGKASALAALAS